MKSIDDKIKEEVVQCAEHTKKGGDLILFCEAYLPVELMKVCVDYMKIYQNVMVKYPLLGMSEKHNQTMAQMNNLYKTKYDKSYTEGKK